MTQEWGKAVTYQRRYSICSILGLVPDMDTDAEATPEPPKPAPKPAAKPMTDNEFEYAALSKQEEEEEPLSPEERSMVLKLIRQHVDKIKPADVQKAFVDNLINQFFARFPETREAKTLNNAIHTQPHAEFINAFLNS